MDTLQKETAINREPLWTKPFLLVILLNFLLFFSMYLLLPTLPVYVQQIGGSKTVAGLIVGLFTLSAVIVRPWVGHLLDSRGRKTVLAGGSIIFLLSAVAYQWTYAVWMLLVLRFIHGVGWGACNTATGTIASDVIPALRRNEGMGYYGASTTIAMALGPALGLRIIENHPFTLLFLSAAMFGLAALFAGLPLNYEGIYGAAGKSAVPQREKTKAVIVEKTAIAPSLVLFFSSLAYGGVITFLPTYAESRGVGNAGLFFTVYALVLLISRPLMGRWADKNGPGPVLVLGLILLIAAQTVLVSANSLAWFLGVGIIYGLGFGAVQPILNAVTVSLAPVERRGAANATLFSAMDLGIGLGAVILGAISQKMGFAAMWEAAGVFAAVSLIVYFTVLRKKLPQKQ